MFVQDPNQQPEKRSSASKPVSPEQESLLPSRLTFSWFTSFIWSTRGSRPVCKSDLPALQADLGSKELSNKFEETWDLQVDKPEEVKSNIRLLWCLSSLFKSGFVLSGLLHVIAGASLQFCPFVLKYFLQILEDREAGNLPADKEYLGYVGCFGLFSLLLAKTVFGNQGYFLAYKYGLKVRSSLSAAIFYHLLELANSAKQVYSVGKTIKLVSADILKILNVLDYLHYVLLGPFQIIFTFVMVYFSIGWPAFLALGVLALAVPIQIYLTKKLVDNRELVGAATDKRIRVLQEMILGIRVIKLYGWEDLFLQRLNELRQQELVLIRKQNLIYGCSIVLSVVVPAFSTVSAFLAYSYPDSKDKLKASIVSEVSLYLNMLDIPLSNIPLFLNTAVDTRESLKRIQTFLASESVSSEVVIRPESEYGLSVEEGDFDWDLRSMGSRKSKRRPIKKARLLTSEDGQQHPCRLLTITPNTTYDMEEHTWIDPSANEIDDELFCLRDLELKIPKGKLVAIVGPVGSGKSSLLSAILGEMKSDGGSRIEVNGSIGYAPQQSWIMNGSIRDNILFGKQFDESRYLAVLKQCAIERDIQLLPYGDHTLIGEKGINLSGGQKARINLARAVYANTDLVLLDDPLSAVDAKVGNILFYRCIKDGLLKDKTRILVTHQLAIVPFVDYVVVLRNGRISEQGTYQQLMAKKTSFAEMMVRFIKEDSKKTNQIEDDESTEIVESSSSSEESSVDEPAFEENSTGIRIDPVRPTGIEAKTIGAAKRPTGMYRVYVQAAGGTFILLLAILAISLNEFFRFGNDLWLTVWIRKVPWNLTDDQYRIYYVGFALGLMCFTWACVFTFAYGGYRASRQFHHAAVTKLFRSPIAFFESTPIGRIVNRFSRDQEVIDTQLSDCIYFLLYIIATMVSSYVFVMSTSIEMALVLTAVFIIVFILQSYYSNCNWKLNKLYAQALSPFMRHATEVYTGLPVIRVFKNESIMAEKYHDLSDSVTQASFLSMVLKRWTSFRVEILGAFLVLILSSLAYALKINSGLAGKLLEATLAVINSMDYFVRQFAELESNLIAVDRLQAYATKLESEALETTETPNLDSNWPQSGTIEIKDLTIAYKPNLPPVIHAINATIKHGEKIAIVGRTGAGKSTILSAIFRLVEPVSGTIFVDGQDIRKLSLNQLRTKITIVPQEPVLFSGTLRFNLDPTSSFTDHEIWQALEYVNSRGFVSKLSQKLETVVQDYGENFSIGQRQLMCLARAILHRSPVILMDEPTASMDLETDELVQDAIRRCFANSTVINISHRLGMIREYDRVMVMDAGHIIEFDTPEALLSNPNTILAQLYAEYSQF